MPMTVVVTRNSPDRVRGFLASAMCEIAPGVYTAPRMTPAVRDRVWAVLVGWFRPGGEEAVVMTWVDPKLPGGQDFQTLGLPRTALAELDGVFLSYRELTADQISSLTTESQPNPVQPTAS